MIFPGAARARTSKHRGSAPANPCRAPPQAFVTHERVVRLARLLKPWTIHVEPRQRIRRPLSFIKQLFAIRRYPVSRPRACKIMPMRGTPVCFFSCENDVHQLDWLMIT